MFKKRAEQAVAATEQLKSTMLIGLCTISQRMIHGQYKSIYSYWLTARTTTFALCGNITKAIFEIEFLEVGAKSK